MSPYLEHLPVSTACLVNNLPSRLPPEERSGVVWCFYSQLVCVSHASHVHGAAAISHSSVFARACCTLIASGWAVFGREAESVKLPNMAVNNREPRV